jgi:hypothetical protein
MHNVRINIHHSSNTTTMGPFIRPTHVQLNVLGKMFVLRGEEVKYGMKDNKYVHTPTRILPLGFGGKKKLLFTYLLTELSPS